MDLIMTALNIFSFVNEIDTIAVVLFVIGLILLVVEIFIPGFGIAGGTGLVCLIIGIIMTARTPTDVIVMVAILIILVAIVLTIILRSAKKGAIAKNIILWSAAKREAGFRANTDYSQMAGKEGIALTVLRPAGTGEFDGQRYDVVTEGMFIEVGTKIRIIRAEGRRIVVEAVK